MNTEEDRPAMDGEMAPSTATAMAAMTATAMTAPTPETLDYDPGEVVASVRDLVWLQSARYCERRGRADLADDVASWCLVELLRMAIAGKYDRSRGRPTTWAAMHLRGRLGVAFRRQAYPVVLPHAMSRCLESPDGARGIAIAVRPAVPIARGRTAPGDPGVELVAPDGPDPEPREPGPEPPAMARVRRAMARLPGRQREAVAGIHGIGRDAASFRELAAEWGRTERSVRDAYRCGIWGLREALGGIGWEGRGVVSMGKEGNGRWAG